MNTTHHLHSLIERYFAGETSVAEERTLRSLLADTPLGADPLADEARAVMGFSLASPLPRAVPRRKAKRLAPTLRAWSGAAAAAVILLAIGIDMERIPRATPTADRCVAYIDGRAVSDDTAVMALMRSDLAAVGTASSEVSSEISADLSQIGEALNNI